MQVGLSNAQNIPLLSKKLCRASILCFGNFIVVAEKRNLVEGICLSAVFSEPEVNRHHHHMDPQKGAQFKL